MSIATPAIPNHAHSGRGGMACAAMVGVDEARRRILEAFAPLPDIATPIQDALGLTLAEDVTAAANLPPFTNSAMDGYAVRTFDTLSASATRPAWLRVTGQAAAGYHAEVDLEPGCAVRIMTGAPLPEGADSVVRFEDSDEHGEAGWVGIPRSIRPHENIRPSGEDARQGEIVLAAGTRIRPAEIGLLAAVGRTRIAVHRRPRVAVLVTGDEVVDADTTLRPGQIWNSNGPMIAAQVRQCGGEPIMLGVACDTTDSVRASLAESAGADLLITTGGVSVGDFDVVKDVLQAEGRIDLWQIRLKPGKPLAFGRVGDTPLIGLPGNPVAACVAFAQFARPAILTMLGRRDLSMPTVQARLLDQVENRGGCEQYARVRVDMTPDGYDARLAGGQGSGMLTSLAKANGLLVIPETCDVAEPGMSFPVQMPDWDLGSPGLESSDT